MRIARRATDVAVALWIAAVTAPNAAALPQAPRPDAFEECHRRFAAKPDEYESAFCFYSAPAGSGRWSDGATVLEALLRAHPSNHWLALAYGHLHRNRQPRPDLAGAESSYRRAAQGFGANGHAEGEILARSNLRDLLMPRGRVADATREVSRVAEIGNANRDPTIQARAWSLEASHIIDTGGDLGVAHRLLRQTERAIFPNGPYRLQRTCLTSLGIVFFRQGRLDEALAVFDRLGRIAHAEGDRQTDVNAQYNILNTESMRETLLPTPGARERLMSRAVATLDRARAAGHQIITAKTLRTLAALLAENASTRDEARRHAGECVALAERIRQPQDEAICAWLLAMLLHERDPRQARAAQVRALDATVRANTPLADAMSARRHMQFAWVSRSRPEAIQESLRALATIETLRGLQDSPQSTARLFSAWSSDYYWASGRMLSDLDRDSPSRADLDLAFSITERLRARTLLDARTRSRTSSDVAPLVEARRQLLREIASIQRTLMYPSLDDGRRRDSLARLEELEAGEQDVARRIAIARRADASATPTFVRLSDVQPALAADEAMLSFQTGLWTTYEGEFGGGSWLIVLTRQGQRLYRIPDRTHFAPLVPLFNGLLARGDGSELPASVRLYRDVFATALEDLPPGVGRLLLIPDGPLQHLAFDALRRDARADPLAVRYELVAVPSATLWLELRAPTSPPGRHRALVLADPDVVSSAPDEAADRLAILERGAQFGRLPHARREGRAIAGRLGSVEVLVGARASEHAVKTRDLRAYDILHLAAHAVPDGTRPERSAVLLAAGHPSEDGLLQAREIADLDLRDRVVILSACQTASGAVLSGEGVLSLARAFFEAGARAVIGTRWPLRDRDAAVVFTSVYDEMAAGRSLSQALAGAKRRAIADGRPAGVWAGLVLLGDGAVESHVPARHARAVGPRPMPAALIACLMLIAGVGAARMRRSAVGSAISRSSPPR